MLTIKVPITSEGWDDEKQEFVDPEYKTIQLEHSLISLSKWESKWHKPFYAKKERTAEEMLDYIKCMTLTKNVDEDVYNRITSENVEDIRKYIDDPMTATTFSRDEKQIGKGETITSELIYYWMLEAGIPFDECQKWHLNRLLTLIRVCSIKNAPPKKRSARDIMSRNAALNAARRKQMNTKG